MNAEEMAQIVYQPHYRTSWGLIVGINAYKNAPPLSYACNDAEAVATILVEELGFPECQIILLTDGKATKQAILDEFLGFNEKTNKDDRVVVFFAGHGETIESLRGPVGYLVPVEGNPSKLNSLIRWDDLTRNADLIPAKHILFIMDACYSGLAMLRVAIQPGTQRFLTDMLQRPARQVITAGKADETVADGGGPEGKNSIFTGYLLEGLSGAASDKNGVLTANGVMSYVYQKVGKDNRSQQTPHYGHIHGDGDFLLRTPNNEHLVTESTEDYLVESVSEMPEPVPSLLETKAEPTFAQKYGYGDPTSPNFGRNDWSDKLGERRISKDRGRELSKAFSWLSLIAEPTSNQPIAIDIAEEVVQLPQFRTSSEKPFEQFFLPQKTMTTIDSAVFYEKLLFETDFWGHYLRVNELGNIEYADSMHIFIEYSDINIRFFRYVQLIGTIWQFMFLAKNILAKVGYGAGVRLLVNLIGTRDSILANFSENPGETDKRWSEPLREGFYGEDHLFNLKCPNPNLQMEHRFIIANLNEKESQKIICDIAHKLGLAYNHQSSPRCFNYNTNIFPWDQYFNQR